VKGPGAAAALALLHACASPPRHAGPITAIAVAPSSASVRCSQGCIEVWQAPSFLYLPVPDGRAVAAAALGDTDTFVVGGGAPGEHGWLRTLSRQGTWGAHAAVEGDLVVAVAGSPDGSLVAAGAADGPVWLWSPAASPLRCVAEHTGACRAVAFSADGTQVLSGGRDGRILRIELATGTVRELLDHTDGVECIAVARDGSFASGARDGRVRVHHEDGHLVRTWQRLLGSVLALIEHEDGWLAGMDDGRLLLLRPEHEAAELVHDYGEPIHALARCRDRLFVGAQTGLRSSPWPRSRS
jgi:WD40 repeat protein